MKAPLLTSAHPCCTSPLHYFKVKYRRVGVKSRGWGYLMEVEGVVRVPRLHHGSQDLVCRVTQDDLPTAIQDVKAIVSVLHGLQFVPFQFQFSLITVGVAATLQEWSGRGSGWCWFRVNRKSFWGMLMWGYWEESLSGVGLGLMGRASGWCLCGVTGESL